MMNLLIITFNDWASQYYPSTLGFMYIYKDLKLEG